MFNNFESLREEARAHILEVLEDYEGYTCDFHKVLIAWLKDNDRV